MLENPYKIIELEDYDIVVPFFCYQCGACCRDFIPQFNSEDVLKIAEHIGKTFGVVERMIKESYKRFNNKPFDCIFLTAKKRCTIYPVRPEGCRLFPLFTDFGSSDVDCQGHREFHRIVDIFFERDGYSALWEPGIYLREAKRNIRRIPEDEKPTVWQKFIKTAPSENMILRFTEINGITVEHRKHDS